MPLLAPADPMVESEDPHALIAELRSLADRLEKALAVNSGGS